MTTIVHTTDLGPDDGGAFVHAVAIARAAGATLVSLHANPDRASAETPRPAAAAVLSGWGADPTAVPFSVREQDCCDDAIDTVLTVLQQLAPDLVVATTHRRGAVARFIGGSKAEAIAHNTGSPTLLVPSDAHGFVAPTDGAIDLGRVLVPIGDATAAAAAVRAAAWFAGLCGASTVEFVLLHIGAPTLIDAAALTQRPGWTVQRRDRSDLGIEAAIIEESSTARLVVMATRGHDSVGDVLRGSHTDRVLHQCRRPLLSVAV